MSAGLELSSPPLWSPIDEASAGREGLLLNAPSTH
jgi:hypothetical protein